MSPSKNSSRKRRVVIIDDDLAFTKFLTKLIGTFGHEVIVKSNPRESHTYELRDTDIVFLDLVMPHVDGIQVLEKARSSKFEVRNCHNEWRQRALGSC